MNNLSKFFISGFLVIISLFSLACPPPETDNKNGGFGSESADITPTPKENLTKFESELKSMRIADFYYIFVLKRKDGGVFTSEDKAFVREKKHYATNRITFIDDEKTLFLGTNYPFTDENVELLKERFDFEDYSKPQEVIDRERAAKKIEWDKQKAEAEEFEAKRQKANVNSGN